MKPGIHLTIPVGEDLMSLIKIVDQLRATLDAHEAYLVGVPVYVEPPFNELLHPNFTVVKPVSLLESRLVRLLGDKNVQVVT